jgi:DNA topoisomerase-1
VKRPLSKEELSAREAGLRYVADTRPGWIRRRKGRAFIYLDEKGRLLRKAEALRRIRRLAIPPAWKEVWICPLENGHLQATGRDARGRKQYRYHEDWRKTRDETKYQNMVAFGKALPRLRRRVNRDLARRGLSREKVLATVVRLLETTLIRVGNDEYARTNGSYGLTTLRNRHVKVRGGTVSFTFRGKSGRDHVIDLENRKLSAIVRRCRDLPGQELFGYVDQNGRAVDVSSGDVNEYIHEVTGRSFTAKDFRTWAGTVLAAQALREFEKFSSGAEARRNMLQAIEAVAGMLGNTPAICRKSYIHPVILDTYLEGSLVERLRRTVEQKLTRDIRRLRPDEAAVLMLLQQKLKA